ncbi:hypothetical protein SAMN06265373_1212 [Shimia sagamensis]|uniref:HK97 gp10 family phage protein n=2 Tax=Shimia sagamensis TaxID=1566352 RepID=A0ABY1PLJ0_9RHOB|nr:hypothetical protein SAMN06265373_1212 [Shimia sagamensis]
MTRSFSAQVHTWSEKAKRNVELVLKQSAQDLFEFAQTPVSKGGNMPVDTGHLRNSLVAGLNGSTSLTGPNAYMLAIAGMKVGDVMFGGWTAEYARPVEYGAAGRAGRFYARGAAQQWQSIVATNAARLK